MTKKWTIAGAVIFIASILAQPEKCYSISGILGSYAPPEFITHTATILSALLMAFGKSLHERTTDSTDSTPKL